MICPTCQGKGYSVAYACPGFQRVRAACRACGATGQLGPEQEARQRRGAELLALRKGADLSLLEAARQLGTTATVLSDLEHGQAPERNVRGLESRARALYASKESAAGSQSRRVTPRETQGAGVGTGDRPPTFTPGEDR